jgi:hypothetical protein
VDVIDLSSPSPGPIDLHVQSPIRLFLSIWADHEGFGSTNDDTHAKHNKNIL